MELRKGIACQRHFNSLAYGLFGLTIKQGLDGDSFLVAIAQPTSRVALLEAGVFPQSLSCKALLYCIRIALAKTDIAPPQLTIISLTLLS